jgi:hypothetical protein
MYVHFERAWEAAFPDDPNAEHRFKKEPFGTSNWLYIDREVRAAFVLFKAGFAHAQDVLASKATGIPL